MRSIFKKIFHTLLGIFYFFRCSFKGIKYKPGVRIRRGVKISRGTKLILSKNCWIGANCDFWGGGTIILGENTHIGSLSSIFSSNEAGVTFGANVNCARNLFVIDADHRYSDKDKLICQQGLSSEPVVIGNNIWIGANCTILKGVHVGDGCVIGACAMVNKSFENDSVIGGVPARVLKKR